MAATLLDGKSLSQRVLQGLVTRVEALTARGVVPRLTVLRVGDDAASRVYIRGKIRACAQVGIAGDEFELPASATESDVMHRLRELNADPAVHGVLVQLPLPRGLDPHRILAELDPAKDVDGLHARNLGQLVQGQPGLRPCTPSGILRLLDDYGVRLSGKHAVVVGRSEIVGKPMALLLLERDATVTVCHSRTQDIGLHSRAADLLVVAVGRPGLVTGAMVKPGAVVVDVGVNRLQDGSLAGDVDFASVSPQASYLTPVPGGVGPMTVAMLIENTVLAAEAKAGRDSGAER